ncbi:MAG TPA: hypothetical protein VM243_09725 [Phycisphaerae bacterium]|nr:hypothetical protein [Phycisphaerae bacterium]
MKQAGLWTRIGHWVRNAGQGDWGQQALRLPPDDVAGPADHDPTAERPDSDNGAKLLQPLSRRRRREQTLETLQEGFAKLVALIDEIYQHLGRQDRRSEQIVEALTQLADTTARLPEAAQEQSRQLGTIAAQLEAGNDRARRWEAAISDLDLPRLAEAQRQALDVIGCKLENAKQTEERMLQTLHSLGDALDSWQETSTASTATLQGLQEAATRRDENLATLMTEHSRRFTWFFVITLVMAVAAITMGILALMH